MKRKEIFILLFILIFASSCGWIKSVTEQRSNNSGNLPCEVKNARFEEKLNRETAYVVNLPSDNKILFGGIEVTKTELDDKLQFAILDSNAKYEEIIFIRANAEVAYGSIIKVLDSIRKGNVGRIAFVVCGDESSDKIPRVLEVKIAVSNSDIYPAYNLKPDPLMLLVSVTENGNIKLNNETQDSLESLSDKLKQVFQFRELNEVYTDDTNEIHKHVHLRLPFAMKYAEVIKIIDAVTGSGAIPIYLQIDDLPEQKIKE